MSASFAKLRSKLSELFQLDAAAELDFGIYRILNARRVEISEFLDSLDGQVDAILAEALGSGSGDTKAELDKTIADLRALSVDESAIDANKKVIALREKLAAAGSDPTALSHEIFSHLATFFSRYYKDGDFISLRRYKKDTYAIPYEGEEVKLHWANADQYYIKSSETLRDYAFRLGPAPKGNKPDTRPTVSFKLVEADIEKDNTKAVAGQERRFVFQGVVESDSKDHLVLGFAYLPLGKAEKQTALSEAAAKTILAEHAKGAFTDLAAKDPTYTGSQKGGRTILAKHLAEYTGRNTFDYFVHKDLGSFLRRELDFYVKNEVLHLDDLDDAPEANWNETRAKLKALRAIAAKVIRFLAQLEDFQKKLWLKKKFVTACDYVVTLDRIFAIGADVEDAKKRVDLIKQRDLYLAEIAACDAQREEWVQLFAIDEIEADLGRAGYSAPLAVKFLEENQFLPVSTVNFGGIFSSMVSSLCAAQSSSISTNLVIQSDNLHALTLIQPAFAGKVLVSYIDPPYNTGEGDFVYKDSYQHSSWLSMMGDRLQLGKTLLAKEGVLLTSIDRNEMHRLMNLADATFGSDNRVIEFVWEKGRKNDATHATLTHEFFLLYARDIESLKSAVPEWKEKKQGVSEVIREFRKLQSLHGEEYSEIRQLLNQFIMRSFDPAVARSLLLFSKIDQGGPFRDDTDLSWPGGGGPRYQIENPTTGDMAVIPRRGWVFGKKETLLEKLETGELEFDPENPRRIRKKRYLEKYATQVKGTNIYKNSKAATRQLRDILGDHPFENPKPPDLIAEFLEYISPQGSFVWDYFAGSGTTGHAAIEMQRQGNPRGYALVEMGEHFDTVLIPRLKKVIYSSEWKEGKPLNRNTGVSHCFKILRLESYEDTLNNLRLHRSRAQELALEAMSPEAREQYQLGYMLDLETSGSQSLLNVSAFTDPWNYTLEIASGTAGETKTTKVDLVETFNWLLGLTVLAQGHGGGVQWVEGTNPEGDKVLVLWRNTTEVDADALNDWCKKQKVSVLDGEFGLIYINGDHHLENLRREDQTWKVRLTDEEFPKLMWEGCE